MAKMLVRRKMNKQRLSFVFRKIILFLYIGCECKRNYKHNFWQYQSIDNCPNYSAAIEYRLINYMLIITLNLKNSFLIY